MNTFLRQFLSPSKETRTVYSATSSFAKSRRRAPRCDMCPPSPLSTHKSSRMFSASVKSRSPYAILKLRTSASKDEIKSAFRKLAKKYHPDVSPTLPREESETLMAELIEAYDHLMDDGFAGRVGDSRVALACEMYTIAELRIDRLHDVYSLKIILIDDDDENELSGGYETSNTCAGQAAGTMHTTPTGQTITEMSTDALIEIKAHPHDSVSDLKRHIQSRFLDEWGMKNRRLDRDGIATGWELVSDVDGSVLSYHLFLSSYGIKNGDVLHAVVRKYHEVEREVSGAKAGSKSYVS